MGKKLGFLQMLRGGAALVVMISHLLIMFYLGNDAVSQSFPYLMQVVVDTVDFQFLSNINRIFIQVNLNLGAYGVAIFFLISGFVISLSLEHKSVKDFVVKRLFRIWPTYVVGFSLTFLMIWFYTRAFNIEFPYNVKDYLIQISLLRDWFWKPSIDGVSWTLEVELKFYLVMCIIFYFRKAQNKHVVGMTCLILFLCNFFTNFLMDDLLTCHLILYRILNTIQFSNINILFMLLGVCVYNRYQKYWTSEEFIEMLVKIYLLLIFSVVFSVHKSTLQLYTSSYLFSLLTFLVGYIFRDRWKAFKFLNFFGEISYPFYIVHGLNGYIIQNFLLQYHVKPYICFFIALTWAIIVAYVLHISIEKCSLLWFEKIKLKYFLSKS